MSCGRDDAPSATGPHALFDQAADRFPHHDLLVVPDRLAAQWQLDRSSFSYAETRSRVAALTEKYVRAGYGCGRRVALLLENRPAFFFHYLALNALGVSVVPVNPDYRPDELRYLLEHSEAALLLVLPQRHAAVAPIAAALAVPVATPDDQSFPAARERLSSGTVDTSTECALLYTSGTTSRPKGCIVSNDYMLGWADWYGAQQGYIGLRPGSERLLQPLPTFHVNAMGNSFMGMLAVGGAQIIVDRFHPRQWWQDAIDTRATCFHYLGVMPAMLLNSPPSPLDRAHALRYGMGGGVHPDHHAAFEARFGVPLLEGWAMTETGGAGILCAMREPRHVGRRCIGHPDRDGPPLEVRVIDDTGTEVPPEVPGELLVRARGPNPRQRFFSGYLKDPDATAAAWADDWLHTGDVVRRDPAGSVFFMDRRKNIIRRSGENISAAEVEGVLALHDAVAQAAVLAATDPVREEEVLAAITLKPGRTPGRALADALFDHCRDRLAYYKLPGYIAFVARLPTTSTQKVRKHDLTALAADPLAQPDCFDLRMAKQAARTGKGAH